MATQKATVLEKSPELQNLLSAVEDARLNTEKLAHQSSGSVVLESGTDTGQPSALVLRDQAVEARNAAEVAADLGGVAGIVQQESDLPSASNNDGDVYLVHQDSQGRSEALYRSGGSSWSYTGVSLLNAGQVGAPGGAAGLDASGQVPDAQANPNASNLQEGQVPDGQANPNASTLTEGTLPSGRYSEDGVRRFAPVEVDHITDLRSLDGTEATSAHVRTPTGQSGIFLPKDVDPFGNGDDGAVVFQASDGTLWVRKEAFHEARVQWFGTDEQAITDAISFASSQSYKECFISEELLPYDPSLVTFDTDVRMVRDGNKSDVYDIRAYGASGEVGRDNSGAIQAAIDAAEGGVIYVPLDNNSYEVASTLTGFGDGATLKGAGRDSRGSKRSSLFNTSGSDLILVPGGTFGLKISDIALNGSGNGTDGIKFEDTTDSLEGVVVENVVIGSFGRHGVNISTNTTDVRLSNVKIKGPNANGINAVGGAIGMLIMDQVFVNGNGNTSNGYRLKNARATIIGCNADNCTNAGFMYGGGRQILQNCSVEGTPIGFLRNFSTGSAIITLPKTLRADTGFKKDASGATVLVNPKTSLTDVESVTITSIGTGAYQIYGNSNFDSTFTNNSSSIVQDLSAAPGSASQSTDGFNQNTGNAVNDGSTFTGGKSGGAYTIDDIVAALKEQGLIK